MNFNCGIIRLVLFFSSGFGALLSTRGDFSEGVGVSFSVIVQAAEGSLSPESIAAFARPQGLRGCFPAFAVFPAPSIKIFIGSYQVKFSLKILEFLFLSTLASELTSCWSPTRESRIISTLLSYYEVGPTVYPPPELPCYYFRCEPKFWQFAEIS